MLSEVSEEELLWIKKEREIKIKSLKELLDILVDIKLEDIDEEISLNIMENKTLIGWLELNFPKKIGLVQEIKNNIKEFTPQQIRESLIRSLSKIT